MFGLGIWEIVLIAVIILIVFGPEKLPEIAKKAGKASGELKKHSESIRREIYNSLYPPAPPMIDSNRNLTTISKDDNKSCENEKKDLLKTESSNVQQDLKCE
jgi:sec-independent protein translocase protein TatA